MEGEGHMTKERNTRRLIDSGLLQAVLALLGMLVVFWLRRRSQALSREDRTSLTWRQDVEVGPSEVGEPAEMHIIAPADQAAIEIENIPEVGAGDGNALEQTELVGDDAVLVEGPIPAPDTQPEAETPGGDDLAIVEGIGPKINTILHEAGIRTFARLAATEVPALEEILRAAGLRRINNPQTWPEQAKLAADGEWSKLETLQKQLKAGRKAG